MTDKDTPLYLVGIDIDDGQMFLAKVDRTVDASHALYVQGFEESTGPGPLDTVKWYSDTNPEWTCPDDAIDALSDRLCIRFVSPDLESKAENCIRLVYDTHKPQISDWLAELRRDWALHGADVMDIDVLAHDVGDGHTTFVNAYDDLSDAPLAGMKVDDFGKDPVRPWQLIDAPMPIIEDDESTDMPIRTYKTRDAAMSAARDRTLFMAHTRFGLRSGELVVASEDLGEKEPLVAVPTAEEVMAAFGRANDLQMHLKDCALRGALLGQGSTPKEVEILKSLLDGTTFYNVDTGKLVISFLEYPEGYDREVFYGAVLPPEKAYRGLAGGVGGLGEDTYLYDIWAEGTSGPLVNHDDEVECRDPDGIKRLVAQMAGETGWVAGEREPVLAVLNKRFGGLDRDSHAVVPTTAETLASLDKADAAQVRPDDSPTTRSPKR